MAGLNVGGWVDEVEDLKAKQRMVRETVLDRLV